jgi:hypothetical protein
VYADGCRYEGDWLARYMHGRGSISFPCGEKYVGEFVKAVRDESGILMCAERAGREGDVCAKILPENVINKIISKNTKMAFERLPSVAG